MAGRRSQGCLTPMTYAVQNMSQGYPSDPTRADLLPRLTHDAGPTTRDLLAGPRPNDWRDKMGETTLESEGFGRPERGSTLSSSCGWVAATTTPGGGPARPGPSIRQTRRETPPAQGESAQMDSPDMSYADGRSTP